MVDGRKLTQIRIFSLNLEACMAFELSARHLSLSRQVQLDARCYTRSVVFLLAFSSLSELFILFHDTLILEFFGRRVF